MAAQEQPPWTQRQDDQPITPATTTAHDPADLRPGGVYRHAQLAGVDLSGRDLSGCDLSGADLRGADCAGDELP